MINYYGFSARVFIIIVFYLLNEVSYEIKKFQNFSLAYPIKSQSVVDVYSVLWITASGNLLFKASNMDVAFV